MLLKTFILLVLPLAIHGAAELKFLGGNDDFKVKGNPNWPATQAGGLNLPAIQSADNGVNITEIALGCPLKEAFTTMDKANRYSCYDLLYPTVKKDYTQCLKPNSCWTFLNGECGQLPEKKYASGDMAKAKEIFYENADRVVTVSETIFEKSNPYNFRDEFSPSKMLTKVQCCVLEDRVKIGSCQKLRMNKLDLLKYSLRSVTPNSFVRNIPRASFSGSKEIIHGSDLNDLPSFEFDVEVCQIEGSENGGCDLKPGKDDPSEKFDTGCKNGVCAAGSKCDPGSTDPKDMCIKCDDEQCASKDPKVTPHTVDCDDGSKCSVHPNNKDMEKAVACDNEAEPSKRCVRCIEYDDGNNCVKTAAGPADFPKERPDVKCDNGGYCPVGSTCNPKASSHEDMCLDKDGNPVPPSRRPSGVACRGGLCPAGSQCDTETKDPTKICTTDDGPVAPIFPPTVPCPGGVCPMGSVCNPGATSPDNMCLGQGGFVPPVSVKDGVPCNGGKCPMGSTCDKGACEKSSYACASMCKAPDGHTVAPLFPGGVACLGGLCPGGTKCNKEASSEKDMCMGQNGKPVAPLRVPKGKPCGRTGVHCPGNAQCNEAETDPRKMCTLNGHPVYPYFLGDLRCPNGIICPRGSTCNPAVTGPRDACVGHNGRFVSPVSVPKGVSCPNGGRCPANTVCVEGGMCRDKNTGRLVSPIFWGKRGPQKLFCPGEDVTFSDVQSPGPSPWVFKGYHQPIEGVQDEEGCKTRCGSERSCGQAVFVENTCYHHTVEKGDDICDSKHAGEILHSCSEGKTCKFYNKICPKCNTELKMLGKIAFCHDSSTQQLLQIGKSLCTGVGEGEMKALFGS